MATILTLLAKSQHSLKYLAADDGGDGGPLLGKVTQDQMFIDAAPGPLKKLLGKIFSAARWTDLIGDVNASPPAPPQLSVYLTVDPESVVTAAAAGLFNDGADNILGAHSDVTTRAIVELRFNHTIDF